MIKLIAIVGEAIESFVDYVGLGNIFFIIVVVGLVAAVFAPLIVKVM